MSRNLKRGSYDDTVCDERERREGKRREEKGEKGEKEQQWYVRHVRGAERGNLVSRTNFVSHVDKKKNNNNVTKILKQKTKNYNDKLQNKIFNLNKYY